MISLMVKRQKITYQMDEPVIAGSTGIVKAMIFFDSTWDDLDKVVVFSHDNPQIKPFPVKFTGNPIAIPPEILVPGKLYVSVIGFAEGIRKTTQRWDVQQAITVQRCGALGSCDLLRTMTQVPNSSVATDEEFGNMMEEIFPSPDSEVPDANIASDEEVEMMFNRIF